MMPDSRYLSACTEKRPSRREQRYKTEAEGKAQGGPKARMGFPGVGGLRARREQARRDSRSDRAVVSSDVRPERREEPKEGQGPGWVFPESEGLERVANRRGVTAEASEPSQQLPRHGKAIPVI